jgi:type IV pilus assembly protein PilO
MQLSLARLPWYGQIGAFVAVSIAALFGFHHFYVAEVQADIDSRRGRLEMLRNDINRGLATARKLPEFQAQVTDLQHRLDALKQIIPDQKDVAELLRRVHTLAAQSNLKIKIYNPMPTVKKQLYAENPYKLQVEGTYHDLGLFLDRISKFPRIINVGELKISATPKQDAGTTIVAECVATTFVLIDSLVPAPGAAGAPGAKPAATK